MIYIGIDPGQKGAIGFILGSTLRVIDCPDTIPGMCRALDDALSTPGQDARAMIEKVHAFYKSSAKSAFCFGENFGAWQAILAARGIVYEFVTPRTWQKVVFDSAKKLDNPKKQAAELAERLFPGIEFKTKRGRVLDGRADALLIAEYLKRISA
jgi:hypothetical protein